ncbi:MAG: hypothetical protein IKX81_04195 [Firmicutes bacterium]|nr:hypothetical protein [Bacillota bacterium]
MRLAWLLDPDNISYVNIDDFAENFGKETGVPDLRKRLEDFRRNPVPEGITITGTKRTAMKVFIPNMLYNRNIDMGDTVWVFVGEMYPAYCIYWNEEE